MKRNLKKFQEMLGGKNMKDKYYTPCISEFYVGFEYEVKFFEKWNKEELYDLDSCDSDGCLHYYIPTKMSLNNFRVKYLDKEDLESLGFSRVRLKDTKKYGYFYKNGSLNLMLLHSSEDSTLSLATLDPSKNEIFSKTGEDLNRISRIKIKNKSELKKLISQLNE